MSPDKENVIQNVRVQVFDGMERKRQRSLHDLIGSYYAHALHGAHCTERPDEGGWYRLPPP